MEWENNSHRENTEISFQITKSGILSLNCYENHSNFQNSCVVCLNDCVLLFSFMNCILCCSKTRKLFRTYWKKSRLKTLNLQQNTKHFFHDSIHFFPFDLSRDINITFFFVKEKINITTIFIFIQRMHMFYGSSSIAVCYCLFAISIADTCHTSSSREVIILNWMCIDHVSIKNETEKKSEMITSFSVDHKSLFNQFLVLFKSSSCRPSPTDILST
jgi:hypothetical protein